MSSNSVENFGEAYFRVMLYRSLLGKRLGAMGIYNTPGSVLPHRGSLAASAFVDPARSCENGTMRSSVVLAGSPLFVTDLSKQFDFSEIQFVLSEQVCCQIPTDSQ